MPRCSVIVVTYNSAAAIESCLSALASADCEVVVVDNASQDNTAALTLAVANRMPLQLITLPSNAGFAEAVNQGVRAATADVLLLLNPDAVAELGAIDAILDCFLTSEADAVGGALLDENSQPDKGFSFRRLPTLASLAFEVLLINQVWPDNPANRKYRCLDANYGQQQRVEQPAGACLAVTRKAWNSVSGMDSAFFPVWFEDVDFCARLIQRGAAIFYCPQARFRHSGAHSVGLLTFEQKQLFWYRNMIRYAQKHFAAASRLILRLAIVTGMGLRTLACLLGRGPHGVPTGEATRAYGRVAVMALDGGRDATGASAK